MILFFQGMETKSLSELKSRKEEIIDHLEDLVGKEEAEKISHKATEPAMSAIPALVQQQQQQQQPIQNEQSNEKPAMQQQQQQKHHQNNNIHSSRSLDSGSQSYSIWTSKSIATLSSTSRSRDPSLTPSEGKDSSSGEGGDGNANTGVGTEHGGSQSRPSSAAALPQSNSSFYPDDIIPFADTPHISRFGPISRKAGTPFHSAQPSQSQAVISDEPTMTAVVRHSKQLTRQVPTMAALYHQNGNYSYN